MSISIEDLPKIEEACRKAREKDISVLGANYFKGNHYVQTII